MPDEKRIIRLPAVNPLFYQIPFWRAMDNGATRCVKSWHRRAGKDVTDFAFLVREAQKRVGTYYYYFPTLELAKKALWDNIVEFYWNGELTCSGNMVDILCPPELRSGKSNAEHQIRMKNGSVIKLGGTDKLDVVGMNGYGYVFSEWQNQKKEAFGFISPILRENGGWAIFNGTMRGKSNHLYQDIQNTKDLKGWFAQWLKPEMTKQYYWINEEEGINVNAELAGKIHPHTGRAFDNIQWQVDAGEISFTLAKQEYLNRAVSQSSGSYYSYELPKCTVKRIDPHANPVYTFWDLGGATNESDSTAIIFATMPDCGGPAKIVDYYENVGHKIDHYIKVIRDKNYVYAGHYAPHDAKRASRQTGQNDMEYCRQSLGFQFDVVPKTNSVKADIEIVRRDLLNYSFDLDRTTELMTHVSNYHMNSGTGAPCHKNNCRECFGASHGADALRTMAMARHLHIVHDYLNVSYDIRSMERDEEEEYYAVI